MPKIIVSGGAGFIGSHLAERLVEDGNDVIVIDNLSHGKIDYLDNIKKNIEFINEDLENIEKYESKFENVDYLFHLAANTAVNKSLEDPLYSCEQNILITVKLLELARKYKLKKFIFSSSAAVYGFRDDLPCREDMILEPASPYALEKLTCESYMKLYSRLYNIDTVSLRYFNVFGPRQNDDIPHPGGVTIVIRQILESGKSQLMGNGKQTRDMIYVDNIVNANILAMKSAKILNGNVFNVSTNSSVYVDEMHNSISEIMGKGFEREFIDFPDGNIIDSRGDNTKIKNGLGFEIDINLEEGLKRTIDWYISQYE